MVQSSGKHPHTTVTELAIGISHTANYTQHMYYYQIFHYYTIHLFRPMYMFYI